ncbi:NAD(P)-binding protein [Durotheca rogersii]|uniref:NAD(P)-binding protein n=1 Tax=Durotheca rogersii TaxID=419775 RepID=UPI00221F5656|nr:NAD(P)-binding protein [Durotheca rogersii]KAI5863827.1 NAD(P)-binding protein [Durotheca rogersii]
MSELGWAVWAALALLLLYLLRVNQLLSQTPDEIRKLSGPRWTRAQLEATYKRLQDSPLDYTDKIPPKLDRRYVVTGGSAVSMPGLVGGYIVLQLLARGTPPECIRIVDIRRSERSDIGAGTAAAAVDFAQADIRSASAVTAAFARPWPAAAARLPLTVFHTAAVIEASERSPRRYAFPAAVNIDGTRHVLAAARAAGADVFSATSSGSIGLRPVGAFAAPWARAPRGFWQVLDVADFQAPLRPRDGYFANYAASKAVAERLVCGASGEAFRAGCIRPANGVYGNPTDNTVGDPLSRAILPTWTPHIVQSFVHGANVAIAHLHHEAVLARPWAESARQAGRPFVVTDPNPPIAYADVYAAIRTLSAHAFRTVEVPPVAILLLAHGLELYDELALAAGGGVLPALAGDLRHLKPPIMSICTHLVAAGDEARRPPAEGGLGYAGVLTTLEGVALEVLEWNREHAHASASAGARKKYTTSVVLAEQIQRLPVTAPQAAAPSRGETDG